MGHAIDEVRAGRAFSGLWRLSKECVAEGDQGMNDYGSMVWGGAVIRKRSERALTLITAQGYSLNSPREFGRKSNLGPTGAAHIDGHLKANVENSVANLLSKSKPVGHQLKHGPVSRSLELLSGPPHSRLIAGFRFFEDRVQAKGVMLCERTCFCLLSTL